NLTLQPFGTPDGLNVDPEGVRVFFVDEPNNGVEVLSHHGAEVFTGSEPQKFFRYGSAAFGADGILSPGEISGSVPWQFGLNGATTFQFSVLIATTVPDPAAYSAHLTRVAVGGRFACGEGADGKIYCWGANDHGQLGQGVANHQTATTPVAVRGPEGVRLSRPVAAYAQICAEGDDGRLYCWGRNNQGQLGTGDMTDRSVPTPVSAPEGVRLTNAAVGTQHTCAEGSDGHVYCWGIGGNGR